MRNSDNRKHQGRKVWKIFIQDCICRLVERQEKKINKKYSVLFNEMVLKGILMPVLYIYIYIYICIYIKYWRFGI